jgi:hypothetical protein
MTNIFIENPVFIPNVIVEDSNEITLITDYFRGPDQDVSNLVPKTYTVNGHELSGNITITKSDISLGNVENTALSTWTGSTYLTTTGSITSGTWNSIIQPKVYEIVANPYITPDIDTYNIFVVTGQTGTLTINAPTGTPTQGQTIIFRIKDNGTQRTLDFNAIYRFVNNILFPTTNTGQFAYITCVYNSTDTKWDIVDIKTIIEETYTVETTTYTGDYVSKILVDDDTANAEVTITLPHTKNKNYIVKKIGNTADVVIQPSSGNIEFTTELRLTIQGEAVSLTSNGTDWFVI